MTKEQAIVHFLDTLRDNRQLQHRLFSLTKEQPDVVLAYIETLPEGWTDVDSASADLLKRLERLARDQLKV